MNTNDIRCPDFVQAKVDYKKLQERAENLHDEVETWKGEVLGFKLQKKELLRIIGREFNAWVQGSNQ